MWEYKRLLAGIGCRNGQATELFGQTISVQKKDTSLVKMAQEWNNNGADGIFLYDYSEDEPDHEHTIAQIKEMARVIDLPIVTGGGVKRLEDVKKYLYAGAYAVFLDAGCEEQIDLIREASSRFGSEKIYMYVSKKEQIARIPEFWQLGASVIVCSLPSVDLQVFEELCSDKKEDDETEHNILFVWNHAKPLEDLLCLDYAAGVVLMDPEPERYMEQKQALAQSGISVDVLHSSISWEQFKKNENGLMPVVVQDFQTSEVLMLAYMNERAFEETLRTGRMNYYSRSRNEQWLKGETSGHFQYVKALYLDCDGDTLLAKVHQIGAACHTGAKSCFYTALAERTYKENNPLKVFEDVFSVIQDRKKNPKEGSYTNYLFDKGIDKILKKVGEEASEIIIAAKNPDPEEIKYEISDFLYHVMVLMAEKGVTWEDITEELANR